MSKKSKIALIVSACLCIAGLVFFGAGWLLGGVEYLKVNDITRMEADALRSERLSVKEKTQIDPVKGFDINLEYADLYIKPSGDDKFYIEYALNTSGKDPIKMDVTGGMLTVTDEYKAEVFISLPDIGLLFGAEPVEYKNEMVLYVPEGTELENSILKLEDGDFTAADITMNNIDIEMYYGNLNISNVVIDKGVVDVEDGDGEFADVQMNSMQLCMEYGNLSYSSGIVDNSDIELKDGNANFDSVHFAGNNSISDEYGNVTLKMQAEDLINLDLNLATEYGKVYTPEELYGSNSKTGDAETFTRKTDNAKGLLMVDAEDGNITVALPDAAL